MKTLGERIKYYRELIPLTQTELGKKVGLGQTDISKLELGTMHETSKIAQLAKVLRVDAYYLATGEGQSSAYQPLTKEGELAAKLVDGIREGGDRQHAIKIFDAICQPGEGTNGKQ